MDFLEQVASNRLAGREGGKVRMREMEALYAAYAEPPRRKRVGFANVVSLTKRLWDVRFAMRQRQGQM